MGKKIVDLWSAGTFPFDIQRAIKVSPLHMNDCLIALGSNLGDRRAHLERAVLELDAENGLNLVGVSPLYETAPVGGPDNQGSYLNAAISAETTLEPRDVLATLHRIEAGHDRDRRLRWGARTLDLDLLTFGVVISDAKDLFLPHPRMHQRRFVMAPVCDLDPHLLHPRLGQSMQQLLDALQVEKGDINMIARDWVGPISKRTNA